MLSSESIDAFTGNSVDSSTSIEWPKGDNVKIILTWHVGGMSVSDQIIVKSEIIEEEAESFTVPWGWNIRWNGCRNGWDFCNSSEK